MRRFTTLLAGATVAALLATLAVSSAWATNSGPEAQAVTPARITDVSPDGGSTGVPTNTSIFVDFDTDMSTSTVFRNIKLKKKGARKAVRMTVQVYTFADDTWQGFPENPLKPNTLYKVVVDGGKDGVRGENGAKLGGVDDPSARFRDGNVVWGFRTAP